MDLRTWAARLPRHAAVVCSGRQLTYGDLEALANRLAAAWRALGLCRGDHVAMLMGNVPAALAAAWAAWRCGVYLTPVPTSLAAPEAAAMVADCDARLLLADGATPSAAALASRVPVLLRTPIHLRSIDGAIEG